MAKAEIKVECKQYWALVFFPVATYKRVGDVELLTVFGVPVYKRAGSVRSLFGIVWGRHAA